MVKAKTSKPNFIAEEETCPYLGLARDSTIVYSYPNKANHCYKVQNSTEVNSIHQQSFCLGREFASCPAYVEDGLKQLPEGLQGEDTAKLSKKWWRLFIITLATMLVVSVGYYQYFFSSIGGGRAGLPIKTETVAVSQDDNDLIFETEIVLIEDTDDPSTLESNDDVTSLPEDIVLSPSPGPALFEQFGPNGEYLLHEVSEGESLVFIASLYDTNIEVIEAMNMFYEGTSLWVGWVLVIFPGKTELNDIVKFEAIYLNENTSVILLAKASSQSEDTIRYYNSLDEDLNLILGERWVIIPVE